MTVCKAYSGILLVKGNNYRKAEVLSLLEPPEKMATVFYDQPRDCLFAFFDENHTAWENTYQNNTLRFSPRSAITLGDTPAWEQTKTRHVFLRRQKQNSGEYEYLGTAIGEKRAQPGGPDWKEYDIR
jgi:hypothetical protein